MRVRSLERGQSVPYPIDKGYNSEFSFNFMDVLLELHN